MSGRVVKLVVDGAAIEVELDEPTAARICRAVQSARRARQRQLERAVRGSRTQHPEASANQKVRAVGGRRADVLAAFRAISVAGIGEAASTLDAGERPVPCARNRPHDSGAEGESAYDEATPA